MTVTVLSPSPLPADTKWAFTTRRVAASDVQGLQENTMSVVAGDLVLARIARIGQHKNIQLSSGRNSASYIGDHVVLVCGDRYAPDQFEGIAELDPAGSDLMAGGGVVGKVRRANAKMTDPTQVVPLGLLTDAGGEVINIARYALPYRPAPHDVTVIGVVGTSMNSGKTTTAVSLAHGLRKAGYSVAGIKATGTGAFGDFNAFRDAGIPVVIDFTDAGMASTYRQPIERIEQGFEALVAHAAAEGAAVMVVELADGVFQRETESLLRCSKVRDRFDGLLFAAPDSAGAAGGVAFLRQMDLKPLAISGLVSCSPLAATEAEAATGIPVVGRAELCDPATLLEHIGQVFPVEGPRQVA